MYNLDHRPRRPRVPKPSSKAVDHQRQIDEQLKRFNIIYGGVMFAMALLFIARLAGGDLGSSVPIAAVGDQLTFNSDASRPTPVFTVAARLLPDALAVPGAACALDSRQLIASGSTVTVMAVRPDGIMLSLAGPRTAAGTLCQSGSQLLVSNTDFESLRTTQITPIGKGLK